MPFTLYGFAGNPRTNAVKAVAEYEGVQLKYVDVGDIMNKETLPKEFAQKFPQTKVPALDADGFLVTETLAIAYYLAKDDKSNLFGKSAEEKARILQWASFANTNLIGALSDWFFPIVRGPFNKKSSEEGKAATAKLYAYLDKVLANKTYLVGERVTFADIMVSAVLQRGCDHVVDPTFFKQYPNLLRYFHTVLRQPAVLKSKGGKEPTIIEKPKEYTPVKKEKAPAAEKPAAAPKAEKAPKEKAAKKPAAPADDEEEEEPAAAEPKAKHPCDLLGKPTFNLEDWKRKYSNEDTPVAMKWFEENYKPDEYSLWLVDYKYNEELTKKVFMSSNLIGGFHTRLEGSRKHLFGSACVYGEDNADKHAIRGVYLCRGQSWEDVFNVGPDYESYSFKQLDFSKPEDKETVAQNWSWEDKVDGMPAADGKVFK